MEDLEKALAGARMALTVGRFMRLVNTVSALSGIIAALVAYAITRNPLLILIGPLAFVLAREISIRYPYFVCAKRRHEIDLYLPHAVSMMFSMATGGVRIYDILRCIAESEVMCGELSREFRVAVNLMDRFRHDMFQALRFVRDTTPSKKLATFLDDMIFVLSGGGRLTEFLKGKAEEFLEEQEVSFESYIDFLGIMAEVYLAVFVLLPLFLLIVLVVMQLVGENVINLYRISMALVLPLATVCFIYLIRSSLPLPSVRVEEIVKAEERPIVPVSDRVFRSYRVNGVKRFLRRLRDVFESPFREGIYSLRLGSIAPHIAIAWAISFLMASRFFSLERSLVISASAAIIPTIIVLELRNRKIRKIEERIPGMFRELSVLNEAGLNIIEALNVISASERGALGREISVVKREIEWGRTVHKAFNVLASRIRSDVIGKVIPIVSKALEVSPSFKEAFLTVAKYADAEVRFSKRIRNYMFTYVIITYMSIFIFLFVVYVMIKSFLSAFNVSVRSAALTFVLNLTLIKTAFFHISLLVGLLSGIIAGVIGEGKVEAGLKHSYVFLMATYVVFRVLLK